MHHRRSSTTDHFRHSAPGRSANNRAICGLLVFLISVAIEQVLTQAPRGKFLVTNEQHISLGHSTRREMNGVLCLGPEFFAEISSQFRERWSDIDQGRLRLDETAQLRSQIAIASRVVGQELGRSAFEATISTLTEATCARRDRSGAKVSLPLTILVR